MLYRNLRKKVELRHFCQSLKIMQIGKQIQLTRKTKKSKQKIYIFLVFRKKISNFLEFLIPKMKLKTKKKTSYLKKTKFSGLKLSIDRLM